MTTPRSTDNIHLLRTSQYAEQLRRIGLDLFNKNSNLVGRVKTLEQALEEERASVRLLKAVRDAGWRQRSGERNGERVCTGDKRKTSLVVFGPLEKRGEVGLEGTVDGEKEKMM